MILIGTSGWQYRDWKRRFYPDGLPQKDWLSYYSERFPVVEVNNTFYMLPKEETFARWREASADGFLFVVKASRYITHVRRLRGCREPVRLLWSRCRRLGRKRGPVLFQLPPNLQADRDLLEGFLGILPPSMRAAFEFRHPSWQAAEIHELLDAAGAALVLADRPGLRPPQVVTGDWSYVRFHQGRKTAPGYPRAKLRRFADWMAETGVDAFAFFNNDTGGAAVRDARTFAELLRNRDAPVRGPD
jgi:uncharacterized protein YecE (DUF72 family)